MQMMYYFWKKRGIRPSVIYNMGKGELTVLRAFFEMEVDEDLKKREVLQEHPLGALLYLLL